MPVEVGARFGPYETLAPLGAGGMGEVYRARDTRLGRTVALKVLSSTGTRTTSGLERFQREAQAVSRLSHPHICTLYDMGDQDGVAFLVMEYIEGETLAERIEAGPLPLEQALRYGVQIAEALSEAHRQGVIHRDLKPGNVMVTRDGVKLLDFGLAKLMQDDGRDGAGATESLHLTEEGTLLGTVAYMAPEQLEGGRADARTDIFALGTVLYEMATGRRAFVGKSRASLIAAILSSEQPPLATHQPLTPPLLERVVRRCLAKDPEERWQSVRDLASELRWIAEGGSETAGPGPTPARRRGRSMLWASLLGVALGGAVVGGLMTLWESRTPDPSFEQVTFRRGYLTSARFAPDRRTIVYGAAWEGRPHELFSTFQGSTESRPLGHNTSRVTSISRSGEMALIVGNTSPGTLARAPLAGGAARELLEEVLDADWTPDGSDMAVVRRIGGPKYVVEFPMGKRVFESDSRIQGVRVSPSGDRIALLGRPAVSSMQGQVFVLDRSGARIAASTGWTALWGLAWSPGGDEVWFTAARAGIRGNPPAVWSLSLSGRERIVARAPAGYEIKDASRDGRVLLGVNHSRGVMMCRPSAEAKERELGWLNYSWIEDLSTDGQTLLFAAGEAGSGPFDAVPAVYLRRADGSPAVRLGEGYPQGLSPDGRWVIAMRPGFQEWFLLATRAGTSRTLPRGRIVALREADWLDSGHLVLSGFEQGRPIRAYVQDVEHGAIRPITPEGFNLPAHAAATPDGRAILAAREGRWALHPVDGGEARPLPFLDQVDSPVQWSLDGRVLYVARRSEATPDTTAEVYRVDVTSGRRSLFSTLSPPDPAGVEWIESIVLTPDARSYCYTYRQTLGTLYVAEGLK
jgi:hypothetical protein